MKANTVISIEIKEGQKIDLTRSEANELYSILGAELGESVFRVPQISTEPAKPWMFTSGISG